ncbi:MAG: SpoIIE family protein phosphatase [Gemmatimonadaceae bacterium]|nr:SpoIIE family protein phosphatase [Gemmatimonadaceae bacterium]
MLGAAICLLSTAGIWRWVRCPIRVLVDCMRSVQRRQLGTRAQPTGPPETRFLAASFNEMIESLDRHERDRIQELQRARQIQERLLPTTNIVIPNTRITFQYAPAEPIGGDYLDVFQSDGGRWLIAIADVCGHGVAAALLATLFKTHVRNQAAVRSSPSDILHVVNSQLCSIMSDGEFITCLLGFYDAHAGTLDYVNAGHPPGLIVNTDGRLVSHLETTSSVLGVWPSTAIESGEAILRAGDRLVLYTDGLVECLDSSERLFGNERLAQAIARTATVDPMEQITQLLREARIFSAAGRMVDDVTVLILQRNPDPPSAE